MPFFIPPKTIFKKPTWQLREEIERAIRELNSQGYLVGIHQYNMKHGGLDFVSFNRVVIEKQQKNSR